MKNLILTAVSALLITACGTSFAASLDAHNLTSALATSAASAANKGSFAIVYGGQDISRGSINLHEAKVYQPILVG